MSKRPLVLVLDDDEGMLTALERTLKVHGFSPAIFHCRHDFLAGANLEEAACLILDIDLDERLSGIELARQLKRAGQSVPVIFITGSDLERTRADALEAGCIAYLTKPFEASALIGAIQSAVPQAR
jgi:FixJ family two-component response regulator